MKRVLGYLGILILLVASVGCEGSYFPMSDPEDSAVEEKYVGTWMVSDSDGDEASFLSVLDFNEHEYVGLMWEQGEEDETILFSIFTTELNDVRFANVKCVGCEEDDGIYFLFRYDELDEDRLEVVHFSDKTYEALRELSSIRQVRRYVNRHMDELGFFDEEEPAIYVRNEDWLWPWGSQDLPPDNQ